MGSDLGASVECPSCGYSNAEGSRYCGGCGDRLDGRSACPACGSRNPLGQRFCNQCGAKLEAGISEPAASAASGAGQGTEAWGAPSAPELQIPDHVTRKIRDEAARLAGERKQVTVLFADVMGSMDLAERIDPERWRVILGRLFQRSADSVHRFDGTVHQFTGDGLMALFGAPIAYEDHAQRACFAALDMREGMGEYAAELRRNEGISLSVRIGINSGEVVVGSIGDDLSLEFTAVGHTVGLAQRMEALAEPGTTCVTEHTARLAAGFVELEDLGEFEVKGSSRPLRVFSLIGAGAARGRLDLARRRGFSRFVGRGTEMAELEAALERTLTGKGEVVGIVGEPGVGKSRLAQEFAERCRARGVPVYEAQCQAHARNLPLLPVLQMMRSYFGIEAGDSDREAREKIAGRLLLLDPSFTEELGLMFDFLAVPDPQRPAPQMDPEARRRRLLDIIRRLVHARGRTGAAVNLLEDLQWMDPTSEAFLAALIEAISGSRTLVVTNFRPEYRAEWMSRSYYRQVPLAPLGSEALDELFAGLLGDDPSLDGLADLIRERTGGNPLFVEEVVRELEESGALEGERGAYRLVREIDELAVPPSVQTILAARIDRLDGGAKSALQAAAAIGAEFRRDLLARVVDLDDEALDAALRELVESEFVFETALYPEPEYAFCHPLTREVAYGSQLAAARARAHAGIARGLQELEPELCDERASLIAQHFEEAGEPLEAARWHARAGGWAGFNDPEAAHRHWLRVRELDGVLPGGREADALRLGSRLMLVVTGWRLGGNVDEAREVFAEGTEIAERRGERAALALLHLGLGIAEGTAGGDVPEYVRLTEEAVRIAEDANDPALQVSGLSSAVYARFLAGRFEEARGAADRILELTAEDPQLGAGVAVANPRALATSLRAAPLMALGRFAEARQALTEGAELCRRFDRGTLGWTHAWRCTMSTVFGGDPVGRDTLADARKAVEIAEALGDAFSRGSATLRLGAAQAQLGELDDAERCFARSLELIRERGAGLESEPSVHTHRAKARAAAGELDRAVDEAELAVRLADERGVRCYAPWVQHSLAEILIQRGRPGDAERASAVLDAAERIAHEIGARPDQAMVLRARARLCALRGDTEGGERALSDALAMAREMDAKGLIQELEGELPSAAAVDA
jgi:class 3 adenylate cyclase/tetratricopeptide (TPR) repeat protein